MERRLMPNFDTFQHNLNAPFGIGVARGMYSDLSGIQKFGYNPSVGSQAFETIWDAGGIYEYPQTHGTVALTTTDSDDTGATVEIQGLDANFNLQTENVTVGSTSINTFCRVFRMRLVSMPITDSAGNALTVNQGDITATIDTIAVAEISAGIGQTLMAVYTIPAGKRGYLLSFDIGNSKDTEVEAKIMIRLHNDSGVFNTVAFSTLRGTAFRKEYNILEVLDERTDIEVRAKSSNSSSVSAGFEILLEDK